MSKNLDPSLPRHPYPKEAEELVAAGELVVPPLIDDPLWVLGYDSIGGQVQGATEEPAADSPEDTALTLVGWNVVCIFYPEGYEPPISPNAPKPETAEDMLKNLDPTIPRRDYPPEAKELVDVGELVMPPKLNDSLRIFGYDKDGLCIQGTTDAFLNSPEAAEAARAEQVDLDKLFFDTPIAAFAAAGLYPRAAGEIENPADADASESQNIEVLA